MKRKLIAGVIIGVAFISLVIAALHQQRGGAVAGGGLTGGDAIGVIHINGLIMAGNSTGGLFGAVAGSDTVMEQLRRAADDPHIKAVVIRMNTPGGTSAASQEITLEIERLREAGKKVVASLGDVSASGGYWIASHCDKIVANPGTITGSIGVIMETTNMRSLYDKIGIDPKVFKSGPHKDMGSPARDIDPEEQAIFQEMVDDIYRQFVNTVSNGRGMDREQVARLADGRIFTGSQAVENGLVDELGNFYDAVGVAAQLAGLEDSARVIDLTPVIPWWETLSNVRLGIVGLEMYPAAWLVYKPMLE
ncbi:MAG: signal peptide peptidase SppA [Firmicutes bacterium]|nr:signal peptide peptidase SppA [Bacillota bacterium]